jgi:DNA primase
MPLYTNESLDLLRQRIDLPEVVGAHISLKRAGAAFKGLCPFHEEKTPSFMIQRGDTHYHCFGCGAHGDAIAFLMNHLKMGFTEAVESLAERFGVTLEEAEGKASTGPSKTQLKEVMELACRLYHFFLLQTEEGHAALSYLYGRGIDLDFIQRFEIGFSLHHPQALYLLLKEKNYPDFLLQTAGLLTHAKKDFFSDRIMFPIRDAAGSVIGFSGRKFKEETYGGKYINSPETPLFKKSNVLFGLSYSRKRIIKEKKALIVEGQIDCLKLIAAGFDFTVAGQGTAFGEGHAKELIHLGIEQVNLSLDGDTAGQEAAIKIGDLFQKKGIAVRVVKLAAGQDPDTLLQEKGPSGFHHLLEGAIDYLPFLVSRLSSQIDLSSPSGKNSLVQQIVDRIRAWDHPVMVHESLKQLADLVQVPKELLGVDNLQPVLVTKEQKPKSGIDPDKILETDLLRLLFFAGDKRERLIAIAKANLSPSQLRLSVCQRLYTLLLEKATDLLTCAASLEKEDEGIVVEMMSRKVHLEKAEEMLVSTLERILQRNWMEERERIKLELYSGKLDEEAAIELAKKFDVLKRNPPKVLV